MHDAHRPTPTDEAAPASPYPDTGEDRTSEEGSLVAEYGLLAVVGATIAGLAIKWASGGAIFELLGAVLTQVKGLVGM